MEGIAILENVVSRNNIEMQAEKVSENPILNAGDPPDGVEHYRCRLSKLDNEIEVYVSINTAEGLLTASEVLFMLAMDAFGCRLLEGYEQFREEWDLVFAGSDGNLGEVENFWQEYGGRCKQTEELKNFLGESTYNEIVRQMSI